MNCPVTLRPAAPGAGAHKRLRQALMFSLGLVATTALAPIAPAAAQGTTQSEPKSQPPSESGAEENSDIDALLNEGEQPPSAAEATPTEPVPPAETTPVAQDQPVAPPPEKKGVQLEEIIVTAQKRSESLDKVPIAISAFDQKAMEKIGTTSLAESFSMVPNMQPGTGGITIRGIGTTAITLASPTVAIHYDGVYAASDPRGLGGNLDIARVEVLRGPQGTLYGRNATAGAINMITGKPSDEFEAFGDIRYGTANDKLVRFVVNQPVSDTFGLRLAASYNKSDGWEKNPVPGEHDAASADGGAARLSARWMPMDSLQWDANLEYVRDQGAVAGAFQADWYVSKPNTQTAIVYPTGLPHDGVPPPSPGAEMFGDYADRNSGVGNTYNLRSNLRYTLNERWALTWVSGGQNGRNNANYGGIPLVQVDYSLRGNNAKQVSAVVTNELDLNFEGDRMHGVLGVYDFQRRSQNSNVLHIWTPTGSSGPESPPQMGTAIDIANLPYGPNRDASRAIFGQLTFDMTELLRLTGGLRYNRDTSSVGANRITFCPFGEFSRPDQQPSMACQFLDASGQFGGIFGPSEVPGANKEWSALSYKLIADYDFAPDLLGYATLSTGYKQGAITGRSTTTVTSVEPETNTNYELGLRSKLFDGGANLNVTVFWMDYVNLQVSKADIVNGAPAITIQNVGEARSRGIETELSWQLTAQDRIDSYLTYLDAVITEFPSAPDALRGAAFTFNAAGKKPPFAPKATFRVSYSRGIELGSWGKLTPTLATYYTTKGYIQITNNDPDLNEAYWRSDAFVRFNTPTDRFWIESFVNNIEDHMIKVGPFPFLTEATNTAPGGGVQWNAYTQGRIVGMRFGMRF